MKKPLLILAISASFIAGTMVAGNFVFADPADGQVNLLGQILSAIQSQEPVCPADKVQHWLYVQFRVDNNLNHATLPDLSPGMTWDLNFQSSLTPSLSNFDIASHLNFLGYEQTDGGDPSGSDIETPLQNIQYSTICAEN